MAGAKVPAGKTMLALLGHTLTYCAVAIIVTLAAGIVALMVRGFWELLHNWDRSFGIVREPQFETEAGDAYPVADLTGYDETRDDRRWR